MPLPDDYAPERFLLQRNLRGQKTIDYIKRLT